MTKPRNILERLSNRIDYQSALRVSLIRFSLLRVSLIRFSLLRISLMVISLIRGQILNLFGRSSDVSSIQIRFAKYIFMLSIITACNKDVNSRTNQTALTAMCTSSPECSHSIGRQSFEKALESSDCIAKTSQGEKSLFYKREENKPCESGHFEVKLSEKPNVRWCRSNADCAKEESCFHHIKLRNDLGFCRVAQKAHNSPIF